MMRPLMPKATAVWLLDNTTLTFQQISDFCQLHMLEIQAIADEEVAVGMQGLDPVRGGELDADLLKECEADPNKKLTISKAAADHAKQQNSKKGRYTPVSKRRDRPDGIAWLLKNYPDLTDAQIGRLVGTTKPTINAVRDRTHWNSPNITAQNPVGLGLCTSADLEKAITLVRARAGNTSSHAAQTPAVGSGIPATGDAPDAEPGTEKSVSISATEDTAPTTEEPVVSDSNPFTSLQGLGTGATETTER